MNEALGQDFLEFLKANGMFEEVKELAEKRVIAAKLKAEKKSNKKTVNSAISYKG